MQNMMGKQNEIEQSPDPEITPGELTVVARREIVVNPFNPRKKFDEGELQELATSLRAVGMLQPITVRRLPTSEYGRLYEIVAGERRYRASGIAQMEFVPVIIKEFSDEQSAWLALEENVKRSALNPVEFAEGLQMH